MPRRVNGVKPKLARTYAAHPSCVSGNDLEVVQEQLGHASIETTTIYAKVAKEDILRAANVLAKGPHDSPGTGGKGYHVVRSTRGIPLDTQGGEG